MKKRILFATLCMIAGTCWAQEVRLQKQTLSANGFSVRSSGHAIISQTIAQPSLINAFSHGQIMLLQGFENTSISSNSQRHENIKVTLFPNPSRGRVFIRNLPHAEQLEIELYDLKGVLAMKRIISPVLQRSVDLDLSGIASGTYTLAIFGMPNAIRRLVVIL